MENNYDFNSNSSTGFNYVECRDSDVLMKEVKKYINNEKDVYEILEAYEFAETMHREQKRKSGDPFIIHPMSTAYYLAQWKMGPKTIIAGLLHDVIEDTPVTFSEIEERFGTEVANMVEAVTKVSYFAKENRAQMKAAYLKKLFLSMVRDVRVIIVKIADRMHNLLTLEFMTPEKQKVIAKETLEIYSSIAHRIGMKSAKNILEDYSFKILDPEEYERVIRLLEEDKETREKIIGEIIEQIDRSLRYERLLPNTAVFGRPKTIHSIYRKMSIFGKHFSDINDLLAVRVICDTVDECYSILGWIHQMFTPLSGRFKDYIATPKNNLYQSLHTTVVSKDGTIFEVQIRSWEMDEVAERGAAAHWKYKEGETMEIETVQKEVDQKIDMFNRLLSLEKIIVDEDENHDTAMAGEIIEETVKQDFLTPSIFILTPDSSIITLPFGSTVIDFAYKIHSDVGNHAVGAKINGVFSPINAVLHSGEIVEIQTSKESKPNDKWLKFARTNTARRSIQKFLDEESKIEAEKEVISHQKIIRNAKREIDRYIIANNLKLEVNEGEEIEVKLKVLDYNTIDDFLLSVGKGDFTVSEAVKLVYIKTNDELDSETLNDVKTRKYRSEKGRKDLIINGTEHVACTLASCCYPLPKESIRAILHKSKGIMVHRDECDKLGNATNAKGVISALWHKKNRQKSGYITKIRLSGDDTPGLLANITKVFATLKSNIIEAKLSTNNDEYVFKSSFLCNVESVEHVNQIVSNIRNIPGIIQVNRVVTSADTDKKD